MTDVAAMVGAACGRPVTGAQAVAGGNICAAWRVHFADGSAGFGKTNSLDPAMFDAESRSLAWLARAGAPVPSERPRIHRAEFFAATRLLPLIRHA